MSYIDRVFGHRNSPPDLLKFAALIKKHEKTIKLFNECGFMELVTGIFDYSFISVDVCFCYIAPMPNYCAGNNDIVFGIELKDDKLEFFSKYPLNGTEVYRKGKLDYQKLCAIKEIMYKHYLAAEAARKLIPKEEKVRKPLIDHLYLILDENNNTLKIGRSRNPHERISTLQVSTSNRLKLLHTLKDMGSIEKEVHEQFSHLRLASEWFLYDPSIIYFFTSRQA